jgi:hypothetical protein
MDEQVDQGGCAMSGALDLLGGGVLGGIVKTVGDVIDDLHTSDQERAAAELDAKKEDNKLLLGQQEINKAEAQHASVFVAGWRPYIGWVCGTALAAVYIPKALVMTGLWVYAAIVVVAGWNGAGFPPQLPPFPDLGIADLMALTTTLLGMAVLRTKETLEGKARSAPLTPATIFSRKPAGEQEAP